MTGTELLPYTRPVDEERLFLWPRWNARVSSYSTLRPFSLWLIQFSIRRSDLWCHRSSQSLRNRGSVTSGYSTWSPVPICQPKLLRTSDIIKPAIDSFWKWPMRLSMRVVIAPTMVLTGWFAWVNPFWRFIT